MLGRNISPTADVYLLRKRSRMFTFLLWCILFILCWPLALLALVAYPFIWLVLLPFRIVGVAVHGVLEVIYLAITLPFRLRPIPYLRMCKSGLFGNASEHPASQNLFPV